MQGRWVGELIWDPSSPVRLNVAGKWCAKFIKINTHGCVSSCPCSCPDINNRSLRSASTRYTGQIRSTGCTNRLHLMNFQAHSLHFNWDTLANYFQGNRDRQADSDPERRRRMKRMWSFKFNSKRHVVVVAKQNKNALHRIISFIADMMIWC